MSFKNSGIYSSHLPDFLSLPVEADRTLDPGVDVSGVLLVDLAGISSFFISCTVLGEDGGFLDTLPDRT